HARDECTASRRPPLRNRNFGGHTMSSVNDGARWVTFPSIGGDIRGYLALPADLSKPAPALVMTPENLGITEHRQDVARRLAAEGFATLSVDLFARTGGPPQDFKTPEERRIKAFLAAADDQAVPDVFASVRYLATLDGVDGDRAGIIGFCLGGGT